MTETALIIKEVTQALADNYLGIGATPETALAALTDDLLNKRLNANSAREWGVGADELMVAIGNLLLEIMDRSLAA